MIRQPAQTGRATGTDCIVHGGFGSPGFAVVVGYRAPEPLGRAVFLPVIEPDQVKTPLVVGADVRVRLAFLGVAGDRFDAGLPMRSAILGTGDHQRPVAWKGSLDLEYGGFPAHPRREPNVVAPAGNNGLRAGIDKDWGGPGSARVRGFEIRESYGLVFLEPAGDQGFHAVACRIDIKALYRHGGIESERRVKDGLGFGFRRQKVGQGRKTGRTEQSPWRST